MGEILTNVDFKLSFIFPDQRISLLVENLLFPIILINQMTKFRQEEQEPGG